jgi:hypothetical protein
MRAPAEVAAEQRTGLGGGCARETEQKDGKSPQQSQKQRRRGWRNEEERQRNAGCHAKRAPYQTHDKGSGANAIWL